MLRTCSVPYSGMSAKFTWNWNFCHPKKRATHLHMYLPPHTHTAVYLGLVLGVGL